MNPIDLDRALRQLRLGGIAAVLESRLRQAEAESMAPIDLISRLVSDELARRAARLLEPREKQAQFRDAQKTIENFDFNFNPEMDRSLISSARCRLIHTLRAPSHLLTCTQILAIISRRGWVGKCRR